MTDPLYLPFETPSEEAAGRHVITVIQTLDAMIRHAGEYQLQHVQEVLDASREQLVQWIANSDYYQPVRDTLLRMLQNDFELS